jgi:hypothetical protein
VAPAFAKALDTKGDVTLSAAEKTQDPKRISAALTLRAGGRKISAPLNETTHPDHGCRPPPEAPSPSTSRPPCSPAPLLGAFHALAPGHDKALLASYLVGAHSTPRQAGAGAPGRQRGRDPVPGRAAVAPQMEATGGGEQ